MLAIIKEESGHLKSPISKNNNNIIGMKYPSKRSTTAISKDKNGYAIYNDYIDCIEDLELYFESYIYPKNMNFNNILVYLENNYAQVDGYANRLKKLI